MPTRERPSAIGGVMGGHDSEIGPSTRRIVLESAYFHPPSIRRTSKRSGPQDRGVDPLRARRRHRRASLGHRAGRSALSDRSAPVRPSGRSSTAIRRRAPADADPASRSTRISRLLGQAVPAADVARILDGARLRGRAENNPANTGWQVTVPTFRVDVAARGGSHRGSRAPLRVRPAAGRRFQRSRRHKQPPAGADRARPAHPAGPDGRRILGIGDVRVSREGGERSVSRAWTWKPPPSPTRCRKSSPSSDHRCCPAWSTRAPTTAGASGRTSACSRQAAASRREGEGRAVAFVWCGAADGPHWSAPSRVVDFFDAKGVVEGICDAVGIAARVRAGPPGFLVPGRAAEVRARDLTGSASSASWSRRSRGPWLARRGESSRPSSTWAR